MSPSTKTPPTANSLATLDPKIVVAMDFDTVDACLALARQLSPDQCRLKVGKELFTLVGPRVIEALHDLGFEVFLDLKFHDIPATVAKAVKAAASLGVWMVNVHASGGPRMMAAAREALTGMEHPPLLIGVTVLTSMGQDELAQVGVPQKLCDQVVSMAKLAKSSGLDGVVCSAQEAKILRAECGSDFLLVTPGIRPAGTDSNDQTRIVTPEQAIRDGSDYLVIGRPITQATDPLDSCMQIVNSLAQLKRG